MKHFLEIKLFQLFLVSHHVSQANSVTRGSQREFLRKEKQLLTMRRERLNSKQLRNYLPPNPTNVDDQEQRGGDFAIPKGQNCIEKFFSQTGLDLALGLKEKSERGDTRPDRRAGTT